ncbi:metallophosphoesterase family protein [Actinomadura macrotermitis]|uniref:Calcineurin-like phosphoesterase domain-containing protein n=1 Tax=Actinomadura macrotermitis TaxID=2585200 RepID=A0A7K0C8L5_9ACTN|nr:metallophosphoesterase [Actinomadura macrotermitis]MQY09713.1 hypothetical protein [Actinomadura macrotermitis]
MSEPALYAISDLHVGHEENRRLVESLRPSTGADWLLVAGDVGEFAEDVVWALRTLSERFATVVWTPGNHELWTPPTDPVPLRGAARYDHLVAECRRLGVLTPEDPYPVWTGAGGPVVVAPLFTLYDYSFLPAGSRSKAHALRLAYDAGVVCTDEILLHPDPYPTREDWSRARIEETERRLGDLDPDLPTVLVSHWPLVREPTDILTHPEFSLWCGTERTAQWHVKFRAKAAVYGHLHIPRSLVVDGVRFEEVSVGYPRESRRWPQRPRRLHRVFPGDPA